MLDITRFLDMARTTQPWCVLCDLPTTACQCSETVPLREGSSVLGFMQNPNHPTHQMRILNAVMAHIDGFLSDSPCAIISNRTAIELCHALRVGNSLGFPLSLCSNRVYLNREGLGYDYDNQAWVVKGKYQSCSHPESMPCDCFSRLHAGENVRAF